MINTCPSRIPEAWSKVPSTNTLCLIDARASGVSGDKYLGALLDLGGSEKRLKKVGKVVEEFLPETRKVDVEVQDVERGEIAAKLVRITSTEKALARKGAAVRKAVERCSEKLHLSSWGKELTAMTIGTLLEAESKVHHSSTESVELHELGTADTLVDVLGTAYLAEELGLDNAEWWSTTLAVGGGTSYFSDRQYPNPPPAVAEILRLHAFPMQSGEIEQELTTPTGAAITISLAGKGSDSYPAIRPMKIGYGAGSKELKGVANLLRLVVGAKMRYSHQHDDVVVLETNVDDITGEVIGHAMERIMDEGARDVTVTPVYMKKNRPGHMISVIADSSRAEQLAEILIEETGTLGVREIPVRRHITQRTVQRRALDVRGKRYAIRVKSVVNDKGKVAREKVEYEDRRKLARKMGLTLREVDNLVKSGKTGG